VEKRAKRKLGVSLDDEEFDSAEEEKQTVDVDDVEYDPVSGNLYPKSDLQFLREFDESNLTDSDLLIKVYELLMQVDQFGKDH
jgi:DNA phosphorothioation-dependent restriction protein DptG